MTDHWKNLQKTAQKSIGRCFYLDRFGTASEIAVATPCGPYVATISPVISSDTQRAFENLMNENGSRFLFSKGNTRRAQSVLLLDFLPVRGPVSKEEISKDKCSTWVEISYTLRSFCSHSSPSLRHTNERSVRLDPSKAGRQKATARDRENERVSGDDDFHGLIN